MLSLSFYSLCFDIVDRHGHSVPLTCTPRFRNAVCCNADYIFVAGREDVHVYTWKGLHIQELSFNAQYIYAIQRSHDGTVLQLVTDNDVSVTHLHAYKVSYISMAFCTTHIVLLYRPIPDEVK